MIRVRIVLDGSTLSKASRICLHKNGSHLKRDVHQLPVLFFISLSSNARRTSSSRAQNMIQRPFYMNWRARSMDKLVVKRANLARRAKLTDSGHMSSIAVT
jgi:hypothetical protein